MRRSLLALAATLFVATAAHAAPVIGKPAPDFSGTDAISGKPVALADLKGKTVVLEWNNDGCPFVKKHYQGNMQQLQRDAAKDGVVWVVVNSSAEGKQGHLADKKAVEAQLAAHKSEPAYFLLDTDGKIGRAYEAKVTPHMFIIDADGTLVYNGAIDSNPSPDAKTIATATPYVKDALAAIKVGKPVANALNKPYGCGVKYSY